MPGCFYVQYCTPSGSSSAPRRSGGGGAAQVPATGGCSTFGRERLELGCHPAGGGSTGGGSSNPFSWAWNHVVKPAANIIYHASGASDVVGCLAHPTWGGCAMAVLTIAMALTPGGEELRMAAGTIRMAAVATKEARIVDLTLGDVLRGTEGVAVQGRRFNRFEQMLINESGDAHGCWTCGARTSGWSDGHWTGDHNPGWNLAPKGPWTAWPHCRVCSNQQGGFVSSLLRFLYNF
jgi:hypothetical protein